MGNGAGVIEYSTRAGPGAKTDIFALEKHCNSGYFFDHFDEYRSAVEIAIKKDELDALEVIVPSGNSKKLFPLHMAALYGKIDPIELLVSAGFDIMTPNDEGQLPLHLCSTNQSYETSLCATYLCLQNKGSLKIRDKLGRTPLHIAVARNNLRIAKVLINYDADPKVLDFQRRSCIDIANENKNTEMLNELNGQNKKVVTSTSISSVNYAADQERIMMVWERFFENAFKNLGNEYLDLDDNLMYDDIGAKKAANTLKNEYNLTKLPNAKSISKSSSSSSGSKTGGGSSYQSPTHPPTPSELTSYSNSANPSRSDRSEREEKSRLIKEWFKWLLLLDQSSQQYYAYNIDTKETIWLDNFLKQMKTLFGTIIKLKNHQSSSVFVSSTSALGQDLPGRLEDAVTNGWVVFYDPISNTCQFLDIYTGNCQYYLPVGKDKYLSSVECLRPYPGDPAWVYPDYLITSQWVLVVCRDPEPAIESAKVKSKSKSSSSSSSMSIWDDKWNAVAQPSSNCNYYLNISSGDSSWAEPSGFEDIVLRNGGYVLCCDSDCMDAYYWWDRSTDELLWPT